MVQGNAREVEGERLHGQGDRSGEPQEPRVGGHLQLVDQWPEDRHRQAGR